MQVFPGLRLFSRQWLETCFQAEFSTPEKEDTFPFWFLVRFLFVCFSVFFCLVGLDFLFCFILVVFLFGFGGFFGED